MSDELDAFLDATTFVAEVDADDAAALARLIDRVREDIEADVERLVLPAAPPLVAARGRVRWSLVVAAAIALAGVGWGVLRGRGLTEAEAMIDDAQAEHVQVTSGTEGVVEQREPAPRVATPIEREESIVEEEAILREESIAEAEAPVVQRKRVDLERLAELDAEAQRQWRAGDRAGAEKTYRALIRGGGRSIAVQRAYAELFSLVKQLRGEAARDAVWREYLRRFPRGRYADDARAGLCRSDASPRGCWRKYLDDFPLGSHRAQAERELGGAPR